MSLTSINKYLNNETFWAALSFIILGWYLSPLFYQQFYVPIFDNLDSNVIWFKILAESGMMFSDNNAVIPNMMSGLPRSSYGSEFNIILWLYYFFEPKTAFIINEVTIHIVAFFSMFIFLKRYIDIPNPYYKNICTFSGALYFSVLPFWSGAGLSIAILPLVTYSLLNIKNHNSTKWDWILLLFLPMYTSFIFLYMFYIIMAGIYIVWDTIRNHKLNKPFFFALLLMGTVFLLSQYRLIIAMFTDSGFISHRTEFDIYFSKDLSSSFKTALNFFLHGHLSHVTGLQSYYILPIVLIAMFLTLIKRKFSQKESLVILCIILFSFIINIWQILLTQIYILPIIVLFSIFIIMYTEKNNMISYLLILQIVLAFFAAFAEYKGFKGLSDIFPIFNKLNILRMAFIQPFLWGILIVFSIIVFIKKVQYSFIFISIFMLLQINISLEKSFYQNKPMKGYASFEQYYAPKLFNEIKKEIPEPLENVRIVSFGIEPAVSLYNGLYTIDGYSTNYPLIYKYKFRDVNKKYLDKYTNNIYDSWGSKVYILGIASSLTNYQKNITVNKPTFNTNILCELNTDYIISSYEIKEPSRHSLPVIAKSIDINNSWNIFLYKINCFK